MAGKTLSEIQKLLVYRKKNRGSVTSIADRLGNPEPSDNEWLKLTPKDKLPQPEKMFFPKPPKAADGSLIYERIPNKGEDKAISMVVTPALPSATVAKKRHAEDVNGIVENSESDNTEQSSSIERSKII